MKIVLLTGSHHKNGTSATLAEKFMKGAAENGHEVTRIDCADMNVHPCIGCGNCLLHGVCVWTDNMPTIENAIRSADAIVFVTPVYYMGMTAQLKVVVDRFYSFNSDLLARKPKLGLITTAAEEVYDSSACVVSWFDSLCKYMGSESLGKVNAVNVPDTDALAKTDFCQKAYEFGKSI